MDYQLYCSEMKRFKQEVTFSEDEFYIKYPNEDSRDVEIPLMIQPKNKSKVAATLENKIVLDKKVKPKKIKALVVAKQPSKPRVLYTAEEMRKRRADSMRAKRKALIDSGLTVRGTVRMVKEKIERTIEEIRAIRLVYAKTWRENNREEYLAYRRELRNRKKEIL